VLFSSISLALAIVNGLAGKDKHLDEIGKLERYDPNSDPD
jgi:hypothetical protein